MAVPPKFAGHRLVFTDKPATVSSTGVPHATHTLELVLDYCCPFSAKIVKTLYDDVFPRIRANAVWAENLNVVFRQQIQPWHPSSTLMHEAGLAVLKVSPEKFWDFSRVLFEEQKDYFDVSVVDEKRNDTYKRLAKVAEKAGVDGGKVLELLTIPDKPAEDGSLNVGNGVTNEVKLITKMGRLIGIHVTPTVLMDGVVQGDIQSSFTGDQWAEWLKKNIG